jgi:hypothetical protein
LRKGGKMRDMDVWVQVLWRLIKFSSMAKPNNCAKKSGFKGLV